MALKDRIVADLKSAMLAKDASKVTILRGIKSTILDAEVATGKRDTGLPDGEIEKLLMKEVKKRKEAIEIYEANGRGDLVENEKTEKAIIESYLPKQLSETEISEKIDEVMETLGEGEIAQVGVIIGKVKMLVGGSADGATVARLVKEKIK